MQNNNKIQQHGFHLVDSSPWPFLAGISSLNLVIGFVMYIHFFTGGFFCFCFGFISLVFTFFIWWRDIIRESTFQGHHTKIVQNGLRFGMLLFIISEIMFFFAFFWSFFSSSLSPSIYIGGIWPPPGINVLETWEVPLLNTLILLFSGFTCTFAHNLLVEGKKKKLILSLGFTILLGVFFTILQFIEYLQSSFSISDGIYGSTFFLTTGFHGFHVIVGTVFLIVCFIRSLNFHFTKYHHFGFESSAWYWHFVDVIWLFLFVSIYWWGGS
jgi:cytochrome c oxidase subunit 3